MNEPLWQPSVQKKKNSLLNKFLQSINLNSNNFEDVWSWSVKNPKIFWSKFWDFSKIIGEKGKEIIRTDKIFNKTKFFPDSQ